MMTSTAKGSLVELDQSVVDQTLLDACEAIRRAPGDSTTAIVRDAISRLAANSSHLNSSHLNSSDANATDLDARVVVAAQDLAAGRFDRAIDRFDGCQTQASGHPLACQVVGYAMVGQGQLDTAKDFLSRSVEIEPCQPMVWTTLGRLAQAAGQVERAVKLHQHALVLGDHRGQSAIALSQIYMGLSDLTAAIDVLRSALMRYRRHPDLNLALAKLLRRKSKSVGRSGNRIARQKILDERLACLEVCNAARPSSQGLLQQGMLESRLEYHEKAKRTFQRAVAHKPDCARSITLLASACVDSGDLDQAIDLFDQALRLNPDHPGTHFRFSRAKKFRDDAKTRQYASGLAARADDETCPLRDRIQWNFAAAKVFDDLGQFDLAWRHYDAANRCKPGHRDSPVADRHKRRWTQAKRGPLESVVDDAVGFFTKDLFSSASVPGDGSDIPIFIVGMPRSGTTLTEQILTSHPDVAGAGELKQINQIRLDITAEFCGHVNSRNPSTGKPPLRYPSVLRRVDGFQLGQYANRYRQGLNRFRNQQTHVTDKMPTNFMHVGLISMLFPNATIIHCRRRPMDVLVSCYCQNLNAPFCDLHQLAKYYLQYQRLMRHWDSVLPGRVFSLDYEDLVTDTETQARRLLAHCRLGWDDRCLDFHSNSRTVHTPSKWQVRQPMYSSSVGKWKRFEKHLDEIVSILEDA